MSPKGESMTTTDTYREASRRLEAQAKAEYSALDLRQASEKVWGSGALMVKAVASERGWRHDNHALLFQAVRALDSEAAVRSCSVCLSRPTTCTSTSTRTG